jgi:hypothetical protein
LPVTDEMPRKCEALGEKHVCWAKSCLGCSWHSKMALSALIARVLHATPQFRN